jgi:hypothetical protein
MRGAIPPLPNTLSWSGVQLKHRDTFTFYWFCECMHCTLHQRLLSGRSVMRHVELKCVSPYLAMPHTAVT